MRGCRWLDVRVPLGYAFEFHVVDFAVWLKSPGLKVDHFYSYITFFTALVLQSVPDQLATAFCED